MSTHRFTPPISSTPPANVSKDALHELGHRAADSVLDYLDAVVLDLLNEGWCRVARFRRDSNINGFTDDELDVVLGSLFGHLLAASEEWESQLCWDCAAEFDADEHEDEAHAHPVVPAESRAPRKNPEAELSVALIWGIVQGYDAPDRSSAKWPLFTEWLQMLSRCYNTDDPAYEYEGRRGITVADEWNPAKGGSFERFYTDVISRWPVN